ncbi:carboxylating nicotinate-nucleotide diphosphorylase, partial [Candidatus Parcubacteria bacterium]|nr:carboxylating nicotinate-nucleotide diphosphorylase [Candidatus Parcubacteria bacterium]
MNKQQTIKKYYNQKEKLTLKNRKYLKQVKRLTEDFLLEDLDDKGDVTSDTVIQGNPKVTAIIKTKESGILAGLEETRWFLKKFKIQSSEFKKDGAKIKKGDNILKLSGGIKDILKVERTIINLMQRTSGIATQTNKLVKKVGKNVLVVPTRKTQWGLVDKKAVTLGGGGTHRLGLYDWILIKDNHIKLSDPKSYVISPKSFWEIECKTKSQVLKYVKQKPDAIMFDNFKPESIKKIIKQIGKTNIIFEASGNITEKNITSYAKSGVNVISLG